MFPHNFPKINPTYTPSFFQQCFEIFTRFHKNVQNTPTWLVQNS